MPPQTHRFTLAVALLATTAATARAIPGDVNGDNTVTIADVQLIMKAAGGLLAGNSAGFTAANADVDGDGKITTRDAVKTQRDLLGTTGGGSGIAPLPVQDTINMAGNLTKNYKLPGGYTLSGKVTWTNPPTPGHIDFTAGTQISSGYSSIDSSGNYNTVVPAGTFSAFIGTDVTEQAPDYSYSLDYTVYQAATPPSVTVTQNTTQNFARPDVPAVPEGTVTGSITAPDTLEIDSITVDTPTGNVSGTSTAYLTGEPSYTLKALAGNGTLSVSATDLNAFPDTPSVDVTFANPVVVPAGGTVTRNIALQSVVEETGHITAPTTLTPDNITFTSTGTGDEYSSSMFLMATTDYTVAVPPGNYSVEVGLPYTQSGTTSTWRTYKTTATVPPGGGVFDFTIPDPSTSTFNFSGNVTGPTNLAIAGAGLFFMPTTQPTTGFTFQASTQADSSGHFSIDLPPGTYNVFVSSR